MCGIMGYVGEQDAYTVIFEGLSRLEYRGYDSSGIGVYQDGFQLVKSCGPLRNLPPKGEGFSGTIGIGHTRWATHGKPSAENAHPHRSCDGRFALVHNGIIENHEELRKDLRERGHVFQGQTDSEVLVHLLEECYQGDVLACLKTLEETIRGSYALVIFCEDTPDTLYCLRNDSPLIIGQGQGENYIASDIPALLPLTRRCYVVSQGEMVILTKNTLRFFDKEGKEQERLPEVITFEIEEAKREGYPHFMLKEIFEQPKAFLASVTDRVTKEGAIVHPLPTSLLQRISRIYIVGMGTARHAGLVGREWMEEFARIPVTVELGSEFRYKNPLVDETVLTIVMSQSGETADTLGALRKAKSLGSPVLAITNSVGSSIAREADYVYYTRAGLEIAVASTKAYLTQLALLFLTAWHIAKTRDKVLDPLVLQEFVGLSTQMEEALQELKESLPLMANKIKDEEHVYFIGRGLDYLLVQEGALKLKEISYISSCAYEAGELKHGTLALIEQDTKVVALLCQEQVGDKLASNVEEVLARGGVVFGITLKGNRSLSSLCQKQVEIPRVCAYLTPFLSVLPLQLLSYYTALALGKSIDMPRNLAKSVTVE